MQGKEAHWKRKTRKADGEKLWLGVEKSAPLCSSPGSVSARGGAGVSHPPLHSPFASTHPPQNACGIHKPPCRCVTETVEEEMRDREWSVKMLANLRQDSLAS